MTQKKSLRTVLYSISPDSFHPFLKKIENSNMGARLASGLFWSMAGSVLSRVLMLCATVLVARMLGVTVYGELGMIQSTIGMFGVLAGFGLGLTATKHVAEFRERDPERAGRIISISSLFAMGTGGLMALGLLVFAPWLSDSMNAPHLVGVLRIGAAILFINALNGAQTGALAGFEAFKDIAVINLLIGFISFPILVLGAYFAGLTGVVWALAINLCFNWFLNYIALRKQVRHHSIVVNFKSLSKELPIIRSFALPAAISAMMVAPANWVVRSLLANEPNGYTELGFLTAALVFQGLLLFVGSMLSGPLLSLISNAGDKVDSKLSAFNILSSWYIGVIAAIPLLCFPELAQLIFGNDYGSHNFQITFALIVFCSVIIMFKEGLARVLVANSLLWWAVLSNALWAAILISASIYFISWGSVGLAISFIIAYLVNTVIILPLYHSRNLIPMTTVLSYESLLIWTILCFLLVLNVMDVSILVRGLLFIPSVLATTFTFKKVYLDALNRSKFA